jgi:AcrR family transcriptional regulator
MPLRKSDLVPRKAPRQQRSQAMVELILKAAARVLSRESLAGFNTNRVAEVAGVSVGSLYQYFPNKAALVTALIGKTHADFAAALDRLMRVSNGATLADTLDAVAELAIAQQYADPLFAAALDHEERRLPLENQLQEFGARMLGMVATLLARHADELPPDLPRSAAADCMTITRALVEADAGRLRTPPGDLKERIVRALLGYLTLAPGTQRRESSAVPSPRRTSASGSAPAP